MHHLDVSSPQEPSLLVFLRHGYSVHNKACGNEYLVPNEEAKKLIEPYGEDAFPLCVPEGYEDAWDAGIKLKSAFPEGFDIAYHSDALRTEQTLQICLYAARLAREPLICRTHLLAERRNGRLLNMTRDDMERAELEWYPQYRAREGWFYSVRPGGEAMFQIMPRVAEFRRFVRRQAAGKRVLVVGHGSWGMGFRIDIENLPTHTPEPTFKHMENCEWLTYIRDPISGNLCLLEDCSTGA